MKSIAKRTTDEQLQAFSKVGFSNLAQVALIDCSQVTDKGVGYLTNMHSIRSLYLFGTPISDAGCETVSANMRLTLVQLENYPKVTVRGLGSLAASETLKELRFSLNGLCQEDLVQILTSARNLKRVEIDFTGSDEAKLDPSALHNIAEQKQIWLSKKRGDSVSEL